MGTPEFAVETLKTLVENNYNVVAVVTQPDKPVGRHGSVLQPSEVKKYAMERGLPVLQPEKMKDETFIEELRSYRANLQVVVAFRMLPEVVWAMPEYGTFNVHAALLPQYRGAAPINWAVINGEKQTGVTTFFLDKDIDTGKIIMSLPFCIKPEYNAGDVYDGLMVLGADLCLRTLDRIIECNGCPPAMPQDELLSGNRKLHGAPKIFKETCMIDWSKNAADIHNFVRGLTPYPGVWTTLAAPDGKESVLKIFSTALTGKTIEANAGNIAVDGKKLYAVAGDGGLLAINELQIAGKKRMLVADFLNGQKNIDMFRLK